MVNVAAALVAVPVCSLTACTLGQRCSWLCSVPCSCLRGSLRLLGGVGPRAEATTSCSMASTSPKVKEPADIVY